MKAKNVAPSLSYRVAMRRYCFSLLKNRSIKLRSRYSFLRNGYGVFRLDLLGMFAVAPCALMWARIQSAS